MAVVIVRHREDAGLLEGCLEGISRQEGLLLEVHVLDQNPDEEIFALVEVMRQSEHRFIYHRVSTYSLSQSRNLGMGFSDCRYASFIDPDCRVGPDWALHLYDALQRPGVGMAGGRIVPVWTGRERWFHHSWMVKEMAACLDIAGDVVATDRILGSNFSVDRGLLGPECFFRESLGRVNQMLYGGEETDLCARALGAGCDILYVPQATVRHLIGPDRMTLKETFRRAFNAGMSRANQGGRPRPIHRNEHLVDWAALALFSPLYVAGYLRERIGPTVRG